MTEANQALKDFEAEFGRQNADGFITSKAAQGDPLAQSAVQTHERLAEEFKEGAANVASITNTLASHIDDEIAALSTDAQFATDGTGEYNIVKGHHVLAKKAFEGDVAYDPDKAFAIGASALDNAWKLKNTGLPINLHSKISGQQNSLYSSWKGLNPNSTLTIKEMVKIEQAAMTNVGIPTEIVKGWIIKALSDLKANGVTEIKRIPWNGNN